VVLSVQETTPLLEPLGFPCPVQVVCPWTVSPELPEGCVNVTVDVQVQLPAGMLTVVVEAVTELKAFWTSDWLQLAALIVCAMEAETEVRRKKARKSL
jgi:hypothetical protein